VYVKVAVWQQEAAATPPALGPGIALHMHLCVTVGSQALHLVVAAAMHHTMNTRDCATNHLAYLGRNTRPPTSSPAWVTAAGQLMAANGHGLQCRLHPVLGLHNGRNREQGSASLPASLPALDSARGFGSPMEWWPAMDK